MVRSVAVARSMLERNIGPGDVIALCAVNHFDSCVPLIAAQFVGAFSASLDPTLSENEIEHLLKLVKPRYLFCDEECSNIIEKVISTTQLNTNMVIFGHSDKHNMFEEWLKTTENIECFQPRMIDVHDTAFIFFSSGTTGLPKGICCSHYGLLVQQRSLM